MSHHIVEFKDVAFRYPDGTEALNGVSFRITHGESVGIVGANGAGKSTLLLQTNGYLLPSSGTIRIGDLDLDRKTRQEIRKKVGVVFQHPDDQLFMPTVYDDVAFGPLNLGTLAAPINPTPDVDIVGETAIQFGKQIATYTMPGQATSQLMVADPTAPSSGGVGEVMIFNVSRSTSTIKSSEAVATLFDSNKDSDPGLFGLNLGGLQFNTGLCNPAGGVQLVPWASLGPNLFTFFAYSGLGAPADPRCFK